MNKNEASLKDAFGDGPWFFLCFTNDGQIRLTSAAFCPPDGFDKTWKVLEFSEGEWNKNVRVKAFSIFLLVAAAKARSARNEEKIKLAEGEDKTWLSGYASIQHERGVSWWESLVFRYPKDAGANSEMVNTALGCLGVSRTNTGLKFQAWIDSKKLKGSKIFVYRAKTNGILPPPVESQITKPTLLLEMAALVEDHTKWNKQLRDHLPDVKRARRNLNTVVTDKEAKTTDTEIKANVEKLPPRPPESAPPKPPDGVESNSPTDNNSRSSVLPTTSTDTANDEHLERRYVALARDGLYDDAALLAQNALKRLGDGHNQKAMAHWADRVADAYRCSGKLRQASSFYAKSWSYAQQALEKSPDDEQLRYQEAKTRFGQIMVDDFLIRGAFSEAYLRHSQLLNDAKSLIADVKSAPLKADIILRSTHVKRQQAEMLRLQGRYEESVTKIREVLAEYPESAFEPRNYARLSEADSLRLKGQAKEALPIYDALEKLASERRQDGFLGAVLWRKTGALQCENNLNEPELASCLTQLESIAESQAERYRFVAIYSLLACAAGRIPDADRANRALQKAEEFGPLSRDYLRTEYAHLALCRGELFRTAGKIDEANAWFSKAFECYIKMTVRWGVVRSWIGLQLTGKKVEFPKLDGHTPEGLDSTLLSRFSKGENMPRGILSANLP
jgi:tetratricopeptide (TPR) repeat protein